MPILLYNPDRKLKTELIAEFVVRTDIYEDIVKDLETSPMKKPEQHYLLVGQRGAGKSTLLNRIKYGVEDSVILKDRLIPILFTEEQYNVSELVNLWESVAQQLEDYFGFEGLYDKIEKIAREHNAEEKCFELIERSLHARKKKLLLLVDNIGDILKKLEKTEVHRLREILQTSAQVRMIVGSPFYLETVLDYHQPFFEFFKVMRLDGLSKGETQELLLKLAELNNEVEKITKIIVETPERIETLRTLTGGVPRTIALMFNVFVEFNNDDSVKDLEKILDAVTPLYKHRMEDLPVQQQKIVDSVARSWDGVTVKDLKERVRLESKVISAQLRQLQKNQVVNIIESGNKNHIYSLNERFFNVWYLMRYGRRYDQQRVIWLVRFLESWCSASELDIRIRDYAEKIRNGKLDQSTIDFYGEVYICVKNISSTSKVLLKQNIPTRLAEKITIEDGELTKAVLNYLEQGDHKTAIDLAAAITAIDADSAKQILMLMMKVVFDDLKYFQEKYISANKKINEDITKAPDLELIDQVLLLTLMYHVCSHSLAQKKFDDSITIFKGIIVASKYAAAIPEKTRSFFIEAILIWFLKERQFNSVLALFGEFEKLFDMYKPIYYSTLSLLGDKEGLKKMAPEIAPVVEYLVQQIKKGE